MDDDDNELFQSDEDQLLRLRVTPRRRRCCWKASLIITLLVVMLLVQTATLVLMIYTLQHIDFESLNAVSELVHTLRGFDFGFATRILHEIANFLKHFEPLLETRLVA